MGGMNQSPSVRADRPDRRDLVYALNDQTSTFEKAVTDRSKGPSAIGR